MMKLYLVFAYDQYYPNGGMDDCHWQTEDYDDARQNAAKLAGMYDHVEIVSVGMELKREEYK